MGFFNNCKPTPDASSFRSLPPPPATPAHPPRVHIPIPVHQARWHHAWQVPLPYPDVTLPNDWHLVPQRMPVPAVPRSRRAHQEELRRRQAALTPEQRSQPAYAADSTNWEMWFALEHEEQRRRGVQQHRDNPPPPPVVKPEEEQAEEEY